MDIKVVNTEIKIELREANNIMEWFEKDHSLLFNGIATSSNNRGELKENLTKLLNSIWKSIQHLKVD